MQEKLLVAVSEQVVEQVVVQLNVGECVCVRLGVSLFLTLRLNDPDRVSVGVCEGGVTESGEWVRDVRDGLGETVPDPEPVAPVQERVVVVVRLHDKEVDTVPVSPGVGV